MSEQPKCETCRFWVREKRNGQCKRHAPKPENEIFLIVHVQWPSTAQTDWCGEWAKQEGKV